MQSFRRIGLKLWKIEAIQNRYPIVVYGVMSDRESKNPRPFRVFKNPKFTDRTDTGSNQHGNHKDLTKSNPSVSDHQKIAQNAQEI